MCSTGSQISPARPALRQSISHKAVKSLTRGAAGPRAATPPPFLWWRLIYTRKARGENGFTRCVVLSRQMEHGNVLCKNNGAIWKRMTSGLKKALTLSYCRSCSISRLMMRLVRFDIWLWSFFYVSHIKLISKGLALFIGSLQKHFTELLSAPRLQLGSSFFSPKLCWTF